MKRGSNVYPLIRHNPVSAPGHSHLRRADFFAPPAPAGEPLALVRPPMHIPWQAHGYMRAFHQAPLSMHICRVPRAG